MRGSSSSRIRQRCVLAQFGSHRPAWVIFRMRASGAVLGFSRRMARVVCMISKRSLLSGMPVLPGGDYSGSGTSQLEVLVGRHVEARNRRGHDVVHAGPDADREAEVIDRRLDDLLVQDLLNLVQQRLALLSVQLARLPSEAVVDLGRAS